jgi:hypothetical protein
MEMPENRNDQKDAILPVSNKKRGVLWILARKVAGTAPYPNFLPFETYCTMINNPKTA